MEAAAEASAGLVAIRSTSAAGAGGAGFVTTPGVAISKAVVRRRSQVSVAKVSRGAPVTYRRVLLSVRPSRHVAIAGPRASIMLDRTAEADAGTADKAGQQTLGFAKYQGLGNDFILVDNRESPDLKLTAEQAARLCDRNFGVGADGVIFVLPGANGADYTMRIINSDGSEPEMCGNGIRCMARFVAELEGGGGDLQRRYTVDTLAGPIVPELRPDGQVCVDMGPPFLEPEKVPTTLRPAAGAAGPAVVKAPLLVDGREWLVTCVGMGNPHCVTFGDAACEGLDVASLDLARIGPLFERHPAFPARTNTEFVEVISRAELKMRVWERGAGPTLACGTGACALLVAAVLEGRADRVCTVHLPGGPLQIEWREADNHVYMTGPAVLAFTGQAVL